VARFLRLSKPTRRTLAASLVVATLAALGTVTAAGLLRKKPNPNEIVRNGLMILASDLDLGDIYYTDTFEHTFTVHNVTSNPIEIIEIRSNCTCANLTPKSATINGNETLKIKAIFNTRTNDRIETDSGITFPIYALVPKNKVTAQVCTWSLKAKIRKSINVKDSIHIDASTAKDNSYKLVARLSPNCIVKNVHADSSNLSVLCHVESDIATIDISTVSNENNTKSFSAKLHISVEDSAGVLITKMVDIHIYDKNEQRRKALFVDFGVLIIDSYTFQIFEAGEIFGSESLSEILFVSDNSINVFIVDNLIVLSVGPARIGHFNEYVSILVKNEVGINNHILPIQYYGGLR
jgi:hypothetical protein